MRRFCKRHDIKRDIQAGRPANGSARPAPEMPGPPTIATSGRPADRDFQAHFTTAPLIAAPPSATVKLESEAELDGGDIMEARGADRRSISMQVTENQYDPIYETRP